ncbi:hypothetical protein [Nonomuraea insulae]|uniref:Uncharacterized protein n=1 Tax=Nonomuraea insulae TaxID=1616787 RepID=A0ABW1CQM6_9ACTN
MSARTVVSPAGDLACALAGELHRYGIASEVTECAGIALVGVWAVGLPVWCECGPLGWRFRWSMSDTRSGGQSVYTCCPAGALETAAARIVRLYRARSG